VALPGNALVNDWYALLSAQTQAGNLLLAYGGRRDAVERRRQNLVEHRRLLEAIRSRDLARAVDALLDHLRSAEAYLLELLAESPRPGSPDREAAGEGLSGRPGPV